MKKLLTITFATCLAITFATPTPIRADSQTTLFPDYKEWILDKELDWDKDTVIQVYVDMGTVDSDTWKNMIILTIKKSDPNLAIWVQWFNKESEVMLKIFRWNPESKSYKLFVDSH